MPLELLDSRRRRQVQPNRNATQRPNGRAGSARVSTGECAVPEARNRRACADANQENGGLRSESLRADSSRFQPRALGRSQSWTSSRAWPISKDLEKRFVNLCQSSSFRARWPRHSIDVAKLHLVKTRIHSAASKKFFVRTKLTNCAAFQHSNQVGAANS